MGNEKQARILLDRLQAAGYDVLVADVETTQNVSEARTMGRWERGYLEAENGTAAGLDAELGGRWVPQSFSASLFNEPGDTESICAANAAAIAADYGCVSEYQVYRVADKDAGPKPETTQGRAKAGGPLVDSDTLGAVRAAATARATPRNNRLQTGKDFGRYQRGKLFLRTHRIKDLPGRNRLTSGRRRRPDGGLACRWRAGTSNTGPAPTRRALGRFGALSSCIHL
ncbi:hypothetical protein [Paenarthrobacter sp. AMU7]|uniref:Uncharacterized protein n=1 Tax=Paenarthrobacter sp. AMU7 TaxID=3162492 RepID=A0AB39YNF1_9MICC